jgi:hypothetical protein
MEIDHPMQDFIDLFVSTTKEDGQLVTRLDIDLMEETIEKLLKE